MEATTKVHMDNDRHFDFGCTYCEGKPENGFEFTIYNKKNNGIRAKVKLDKIQMLGLADSICKCLGNDGAE